VASFQLPRQAALKYWDFSVSRLSGTVKLAVDLGRPSLMMMVMFLVRFGTLFFQSQFATCHLEIMQSSYLVRRDMAACELRRWVCGELVSRSGCWSDFVKVAATMEMERDGDWGSGLKMTFGDDVSGKRRKRRRVRSERLEEPEMARWKQKWKERPGVGTHRDARASCPQFRRKK
jgi:hypothetical protein